MSLNLTPSGSNTQVRFVKYKLFNKGCLILSIICKNGVLTGTHIHTNIISYRHAIREEMP
jgi:hypothetical protein